MHGWIAAAACAVGGFLTALSIVLIGEIVDPP
jgi:hypothetical protein